MSQDKQLREVVARVPKLYQGLYLRALKSKAIEEILKLEARGASLEEMLPLISGEAYRRVFLDGELDAGVNSIGEVVGLINDIPTVKELIERIVSEAEAIIRRLPSMAGTSRK